MIPPVSSVFSFYELRGVELEGHGRYRYEIECNSAYIEGKIYS
jgi:hypothetical protein